MSEINLNNYEFTKDVSYSESYLIAKIQFKKIIKNFNSRKFKKTFDELFFYEKNYKSFLKKDDKILCGVVGYLLDDCLFTDIFFWNILYQKTNSLEYRYFCDSNFIALSKMGINNVITPLDKSRYRHESFKKYLQKLFFTKKEHKLLDKKLISLYKNYYLLEMNIEEYFEKSQEVKRIKI